MTEQEFIKTARYGGYATLPIIRKYVSEHEGGEYTTNDLIEVHRRDEKRYYLQHKPSENNSTTKKIYGIQQP